MWAIFLSQTPWSPNISEVYLDSCGAVKDIDQICLIEQGGQSLIYLH